MERHGVAWGREGCTGVTYHAEAGGRSDDWVEVLVRASLATEGVLRAVGF